MAEEEPRKVRWRIRALTSERVVEEEGEGTLDEVVIDAWFHLEQMDHGTWWMQIGDARVWVQVGSDGRPVVEVERGKYGS